MAVCRSRGEKSKARAELEYTWVGRDSPQDSTADSDDEEQDHGSIIVEPDRVTAGESYATCSSSKRYGKMELTRGYGKAYHRGSECRGCNFLTCYHGIGRTSEHSLAVASKTYLADALALARCRASKNQVRSN
jgi:hypothetical protein